MTAPLHAHLAAAVAAFVVERDLATVLDELLAAWRLLPAVEIADLIDLVSDCIPAAPARRATKPPGSRFPAGARAAELGAWLAPIAQAADPETFRRWHASLAELPRDPRVSRRLVELVDDESDWYFYWNARATPLIVAISDPRVPAQLARRRRSGAVQRLTEAVADFPPPPVLDDEALAHCLRLHELLAPAGEAQLRAQSDASARLVLADQLLQSLRPVDRALGELIVLQCQRAETNGPVSARERELLDEWTGTLLGELAAYVREPRFERGELYACIASREFLRAADLPAAATLVELDLRWADQRFAIITHPNLRALRVVRAVSVAVLAELLRRDLALPLTHVSCSGTLGLPFYQALHRAGLPALVELELAGRGLGVPSAVDAGELASLLGTAVGRRLRALGIGARLRDVLALRRVLDEQRGALERLRVIEVADTPSWELTWRREDGDRFDQLAITLLAEPPAKVVDRLIALVDELGPDDLTAVRLDGVAAPAAPAALAAALARFDA